MNLTLQQLLLINAMEIGVARALASLQTAILSDGETRQNGWVTSLDPKRESYTIFVQADLIALMSKTIIGARRKGSRTKQNFSFSPCTRQVSKVKRTSCEGVTHVPSLLRNATLVYILKTLPLLTFTHDVKVGESNHSQVDAPTLSRQGLLLRTKVSHKVDILSNLETTIQHY